MSTEDFSWSEVAERSAKGLCPASLGYDEPHVPAGDGTCAECGATIDEIQVSLPADIRERIGRINDIRKESGDAAAWLAVGEILNLIVEGAER